VHLCFGMDGWANKGAGLTFGRKVQQGRLPSASGSE
jgi:hypothetical protein